MKYRDLPYYKGIRAKTRREYKLHKNKQKNHANSLHTFRKWSVLSGHSKHWLILHSMVSTAIYSSNAIKDGGPNLDSGSVKKTSCHFLSLHTNLCCYSGYLTFLLQPDE